ncbi:MAG: hypothetical protein RR794_03380, partial [Raoultibacter sp.]
MKKNTSAKKNSTSAKKKNVATQKKAALTKKKSTLATLDEKTKYLTPIFGSEASDAAMPLDALGANPIDPRVTYEMITEYLSIEGNATQNLTTFCQTYMDPTATKIMAENMDKNAID